MRLKPIEIELDWSDSLPICSLRSVVFNKLQEYGEPLRWAITNVSSTTKKKDSRKLNIEAVVIIS